MMESKPNKAPLSLTDSVHYKSALRANKLENNRLGKLEKAIKTDRKTSYQKYDREWKNVFKWAVNINNSTGHADLEKYLQIIDKQKEENVAPSYYFMYGMRIGEKPQLMKNFLGKRPTTEAGNRRAEFHRDIKTRDSTRTTPPSMDRRPSTVSTMSLHGLHESGKEGNKVNQIMIGTKVVTQVPIGYNESCKRSRKWFSSCSSAGMRIENTRIPDYYALKHKYILPPVCMFR